jgi:hypothetical protein
MILLRAEGVADKTINGALDRSVVVPALRLQEPLLDQTIDLRVVQRDAQRAKAIVRACTKKPHALGWVLLLIAATGAGIWSLPWRKGRRPCALALFPSYHHCRQLMFTAVRRRACNARRDM